MTDHPDPTPPPDASGGGVVASRPRRTAAGPLSAWMPAGQYVHLVYLANLLWQPLFDESSTWADWAVVAAIVVVFLPIYVLGHHPDPRLRRVSLAATIVLGTVGTMFNIGASVLFVYAIAEVPWLDRRRVVWWQVGLTAWCGVLVAVRRALRPRVRADLHALPGLEESRGASP